MPTLLTRLAARAALLLGLVALPGCWPGVAWAPDSSGFYYTDGEKRDKLMFFDVATKKARVVVADTKAQFNLWPAVRADGKEIVLARVAEQGDKAVVKLVFFSPDGKELRTTKEFTVPLDAKDPNKKDAKAVVQAYWSAKPNKILLSITGMGLIYDVAGDKFTFPDGAVFTFGNSPFRPDGKGFLGIQMPKDKADLKDMKYGSFDWDGKFTELKFGEGQDKLEAKDGDLRPLFLLFMPGLHRSRWEAGAALAETMTMQLRMDYDKGKVSMKTVAGEKAADGKFLHDAASLAGSKVRVQVVDLGAPKKLSFEPKKEAKKPDFRLEVVKEGQKAQVVREDLESCVLIPSPDKRFVAAVCQITAEADQPQRYVMVVIGPQGDVLATVDTAPVKAK